MTTDKSDNNPDNDEESTETESAEKKDSAPKKRLSIPSGADFIIFKNKINDKIRHYIHFARHNFKPSLLTGILSASGIAVAIACGVWQLSVYDRTEILIEKIDRNSTKSVEELPPASMLGDPEQYDYRPATASGEMMFLKSINLMHKEFDGKQGYHILTPLRTDNGEVVLVNRGWVEDGKSPNNAYWKTTGITVKGYARVPEPKGRFTDDNNVKKNEWHWVDLEAIANYAGVMKLHPLIIEQEKPEGAADVFPVGGQTSLEISNHHKRIAVFLFILSVILFITWLTDSFRNGLLLNAAVDEAKKETVEGSETDEDGEIPTKKKTPADDEDEDVPPAAKPKEK